MRNFIIGCVSIAACLAMAGCIGARLPIPPPDGIPYPPAEVEKEDIFHVPTGIKLSLDQAIEMISGARLVYIGEMHSNLHAHRVELTVIHRLNSRFPGKIAIGMEMFRENQQEALDRWTRGELTEREFLKESQWYSNWSSDFAYYRDILTFARDNGIDVIGLNPSLVLQQAVSMRGLDKLPEDVRSQLPDIDESDPYARAVAEAIYAGHLPSKGMFDSFYRVQLLWEESMAERIVDYLKSPRGAGKKMVVITGGWHVKNGFGVPKKTLRRLPAPYTIILPKEISIPKEKRERLTMEVDLPDLPLLPSDFIWMVPYEDLYGDRVLLGVLMSEKDNVVLVEDVMEGYPASDAGIKQGDLIRSFDGHPVAEMVDIQILVSEKKEGDDGIVVVERSGEELTIQVTFFKVSKEPSSE